MNNIFKYEKRSLGGVSGLIMVLLLLGAGCKKLIEVDPPITSVTGNDVFTSNTTAAAVLTGIYTNIAQPYSIAGGGNSISVLSGLSADELTLLSGTLAPDLNYYTNSLTSTIVSQSNDFWTQFYQQIYVTNSAIEGLTNNNNLTPSVQRQLLGEALFIRAFFYFYLVNLYGDVPLITTSNYKTNALFARTPKAQVWTQIISDLNTAKSLLSADYLDATRSNISSAKIFPTKWAAQALLARAYLYQSKFTDAIGQADTLINNTAQFKLDSLNGVFLANSDEAIWQLQPVTTGTTNTPDAAFFIPLSDGVTIQPPVAYLSPFLLNSFEQGDLRKKDWVDSATANGVTYYYPFKYKVYAQNAPVTEFEMVLRLGEQYLIRAEAEANSGNSSAAIADLNVIRNRAGLQPYSASVNGPLLTAILHERQVEFFTEWGQRWLDLKRTGTINQVMGSPGNVCQQKGGSWNPDFQLYPISISEIQRDPNLKQNPGY